MANWKNKAIEVSKEFGLNEDAKSVVIDRPQVARELAYYVLYDAVFLNESAIRSQKSSPSHYWEKGMREVRGFAALSKALSKT